MDGAPGLHKRPVTRLWYRRIPEPVESDLLIERVMDPRIGTDELFAGLLPVESHDQSEGGPAANGAGQNSDESQGHGERSIAKSADAASNPSAANGLPAEWRDEWRTVPPAAPSLLLSGTSLLDARVPGPVLRPGCRYRVISLNNGVVGLAVATSSGEVATGYCAAVDLICIDSRFAARSATRQLGAAAGSLRAKVQRISWNLAQTTTSILS